MTDSTDPASDAGTTEGRTATDNDAEDAAETTSDATDTDDDTTDAASPAAQPDEEAEESAIDPTPAPTLTFDDVCGLEEQKEQLRRTVLRTTRSSVGSVGIISAMLYGPTGSGRRRLARALVGELGRLGYQYDHVKSLHNERRGPADQLRDIVEGAREHEPIVLLLECFSDHPMGGARQFAASIRELRQSDADVIVVGVVKDRKVHRELTAQYFTEFGVRLEVPMPDRDRRRAVLEAAVTEACDAMGGRVQPGQLDYDHLALETEEFGVGDLRTTVRRAVLATQDRSVLPDGGSLGEVESSQSVDPRQLGMETLVDAVRGFDDERLESVRAKNALRDIDVSDVTFDDVGGLDEAKRQLREVLETPLEWEAAYEEFDLATNSGILLHGPPGTGKTMLAKAVANETGRSFISVSGPELKGHGGAENRLRGVFEKARRNAPSVVFFDEFDAIGLHRDDAQHKVDIVATLLTELDGLRGNEDVVVMAATNRPQRLDPALVRSGRFDHLVPVSPPDDDAQREVFEVHTEALPLAADVTVTRGDIEAARAEFHSARQGLFDDDPSQMFH